MSGTPTEAEIQAQWRAAIDILESTRSFADGTIAGPGGKLDVLMQALEGEYLPAELAAFGDSMRQTLSGAVSSAMAATIIRPVLYEYGRFMSGGSGAAGFGGGYRNPVELFRALYEWFAANALTVKSRGITFGSPSYTGGNIGNAALARLTVDAKAFPMEACHVEKKIFRCRADQNSGIEKWAEAFEVIGAAQSFDNLLRAARGSGETSRALLICRHAGSGGGGSLLQNSSFSDYAATSTPKFSGWDQASGAASILQDTTNVYRSHPGSQLDASLRINGGGGTVLIKQPLSSMRVRRLDPTTPYFFRVMLNKTIGSASGGTVTIRLGSRSASVSIASLGSGWQELHIALTESCWLERFEEDPMDVEIEWASSTSGYLLVDDAIFAPFDRVDGTYWLLRHNAAAPLANLTDDTIHVTDTGGAPAAAKIQWWLWVSGFGYLPSTSGTPTFTEP